MRCAWGAASDARLLRRTVPLVADGLRREGRGDPAAARACDWTSAGPPRGFAADRAAALAGRPGVPSRWTRAATSSSADVDETHAEGSHRSRIRSTTVRALEFELTDRRGGHQRPRHEDLADRARASRTTYLDPSTGQAGVDRHHSGHRGRLGPVSKRRRWRRRPCCSGPERGLRSARIPAGGALACWTTAEVLIAQGRSRARRPWGRVNEHGSIPGQHMWWLASRSMGVVAMALVSVVGRPTASRCPGSLGARTRRGIAHAGPPRGARTERPPCDRVPRGSCCCPDTYLHPGLAGIAIPFVASHPGPFWTALGVDRGLDVRGRSR